MDRDYDLITLINGITILHIPVGTKVAHVQIDIIGGSDDEVHPSMYEIAHLLEHMIAMLTSTRDTRTYKQIARDLEEMGINWNAFVTPQRTGYFLSGPSKSFDVMLTTLLNAVINFKPTKDLFSNEKAAVEQELKRISNQSSTDIEEVHSQILYPNHPRSASIADRIKNLQTLTLKQLLQFKSDYYSTKDMLLTIASPFNSPASKGNEESKKLIDWLVRRLESLPMTSRKLDLPKLERMSTLKRLFLVHVFKKNVTSSRMLITFKIPYLFFNIRVYYSLMAISTTLTMGFSSRLLERLRSVEGLIYSISSSVYLDPYDKNMSTFTIETKTNNEWAGRAILSILDELKELGKRGITQSEFNKYQNRIKFHFNEEELILHPTKWVLFYSQNALWKTPILLNSEHKKVALSVEQKEINDLARDVFIAFNTAVITYEGPIDLNEDIRRGIPPEFIGNRELQGGIERLISLPCSKCLEGYTSRIK